MKLFNILFSILFFANILQSIQKQCDTLKINKNCEFIYKIWFDTVIKNRIMPLVSKMSQDYYSDGLPVSDAAKRLYDKLLPLPKLHANVMLKTNEVSPAEVVAELEEASNEIKYQIAYFIEHKNPEANQGLQNYVDTIEEWLPFLRLTQKEMCEVWRRELLEDCINCLNTNCVENLKKKWAEYLEPDIEYVTYAPDYNVTHHDFNQLIRWQGNR